MTNTTAVSDNATDSGKLETTDTADTERGEQKGEQNEKLLALFENKSKDERPKEERQRSSRQGIIDALATKVVLGEIDLDDLPESQSWAKEEVQKALNKFKKEDDGLESLRKENEELKSKMARANEDAVRKSILDAAKKLPVNDQEDFVKKVLDRRKRYPNDTTDEIIDYVSHKFTPEKRQSTRIVRGDIETLGSVITSDQLAKLSQAEYNKMTEKIRKGEVQVKR